MIYSTQNQLNLFLIVTFLGLFSGLIFQLIKFIFKINFSKKIIKNVFFTIFFAIFYFIFNIFLILFNFGEFSLTLLFGLILGFIWFESLSKNLLVFLKILCYNKFIKRKQNLNEISKKN